MVSARRLTEVFELSSQLGFTPLHLASMFGHTDIVAYLIAKGQPVDLVDRHGMTPLMHAADQITR